MLDLLSVPHLACFSAAVSPSKYHPLCLYLSKPCIIQACSLISNFVVSYIVISTHSIYFSSLLSTSLDLANTTFFIPAK
jgi:hypothetical protein